MNASRVSKRFVELRYLWTNVARKVFWDVMGFPLQTWKWLRKLVGQFVGFYFFAANMTNINVMFDKVTRTLIIIKKVSQM